MPTLAEVWAEMIEQVDKPKLSPATIKDYEDRAKRLFLPTLGRKLICDVTTADIDRIVSAASGERNRAYVLALLKKTFNHAKRARLLPEDHRNPTDEVKVKRRRKSVARALDPQEIAAFGRSLSEVEHSGAVSPWLANLFRLALICGLRPGEVRTLVWKNVDFDRQQAIVSGKTGSRTIHLTDAAILVLRSTPRIENNPYVFCGRRQGEPLAGIYRALQMVAERAGVQKFRPCDLRRSAATGALASGADVRAVQALLGHADLRTTQSYLHETEGRRRAAAESAAKLGARRTENPGLVGLGDKGSWVRIPPLRPFNSFWKRKSLAKAIPLMVYELHGKSPHSRHASSLHQRALGPHVREGGKGRHQSSSSKWRHCTAIKREAVARTGGSMADPPKASPSFFIVNSNVFSLSYQFRATNPRIPGTGGKTVWSYTHFDVWQFGTNFVNVDVLKSGSWDPAAPCGAPSGPTTGCSGATEIYGLFRSTFGLNQIFSTKAFSAGPLNNLSLAVGADANSENTYLAPRKRSFVAGFQLSFDLPFKGNLNLSPLYYKEWNHNRYLMPFPAGFGVPGIPDGETDFRGTWAVEINYSMPLGFLPPELPLTFSGRANFYGPKGTGVGNLVDGETPTTTEFNSEQKLSLDLGKVLAGDAYARMFDVWVAYRYWQNKFGLNHQTSPVCTRANKGSCTEQTFVSGVSMKF